MARAPRVGDDLAMAATEQTAVKAPFAGVVVALPCGVSERVGAGAPVAVLEAMKMEHEVLAETDGVVGELAVAIGDAVEEGQLLLTLAPGDGAGATDAAAAEEREAPGERADLHAVRAGTSTAAAPPARTSKTCSTRAASSSTGRCCSRPRSNGAAARS
jgi:multidrug efflux pump subunit AcrA (membrane-fusion protein)